MSISIIRGHVSGGTLVDSTVSVASNVEETDRSSVCSQVEIPPQSESIHSEEKESESSVSLIFDFSWINFIDFDEIWLFFYLRTFIGIILWVYF